MNLAQFLDDVRSEMHELLWHDLPARHVSDERQLLQTRLEESESALHSQQVQLDRVRDRLRQKEQQATWLAERVQIYLNVGDRPNAWRYALELDHVRARVQDYRSRLHRERHAYQYQRNRVHWLRQQLAELADASYAVS
jgi:hypothetical protein